MGRRPAAIVCLGVILRGETMHAELIGRAVMDGLMQVGLRHGLAVIHEVLLPENEAQAQRRCPDRRYNQGLEAAQTALQMARWVQRLTRQPKRPPNDTAGPTSSESRSGQCSQDVVRPVHPAFLEGSRCVVPPGFEPRRFTGVGSREAAVAGSGGPAERASSPTCDARRRSFEGRFAVRRARGASEPVRGGWPGGGFTLAARNPDREIPADAWKALCFVDRGVVAGRP